MKVIHINTVDIEGGAARAAYRLHQGLLKIGHNSQLLTRSKTSHDLTVLEVSCLDLEKNSHFVYSNYIQKHYINNNRNPLSNTLFSLCYLGFNLEELPIIKTADVLNLHWVANDFQSSTTIKKLLNLGKPVIWTLHDMNPFTGGCHYSAGCKEYEAECLNCPQLSNDIYGLTHATLQDKLEFINYPNLVIVSPSQWLADCAKKSQVFRHHRVEVIPYSLNTEIFKPTPKYAAKETLNLCPNTINLLIGAVSGKEKRKGFYELIKVLKICQTNPQFAQLVTNNKIQISCFGEPNEDLNQLELKINSFGVIDSDEKLAIIYSAADIFILPSLEDNFPNTMLEAMSCGTPVIAFNIGGIPDLVQNEVTGFITPENDLQAMAEKIIELVKNNQLRENMSEKCRQIISDHYSLEIQAYNYLNLYQDLLNRFNSFPQNLDLNQESSNLNQELNELNSSLVVSLNSYSGSNLDKIYADISLHSVTKELDDLQELIINKNEELQELHNIIKNNYFQIEKTEELLKKTQAQLSETQAQLSETQTQLSNNNLKLNEYKTRIIAMESSKFWLLRSKWFKFRKRLGIRGD
jgi:glycosyltransferase involved in cell wall biosynthesis